ncbi:SIS domain-containing protein [Massilia sp. TS11]|uniref:SIS domain-containing protein n=1 Tax=Massilia sp. TS11 TaxID=2908003 RepID=UPI001EDA1F97|nr:SIS domain-containing protein [Massilia sp. TS11]MCG2586649.1 SIS domain-containing protein [Massilia sp. TS11]
MQHLISSYTDKLAQAMRLPAMQHVPALAEAMRTAWKTGKTVYFCGNGGSAGNAIHLANDFTYGVGKQHGIGMKVEALPANAAVITCLANDIGYDLIFAEQLRVKGAPGDVLVVLSGSGNSPNVVKALEMGNSLGMHTFALLGYSGGKCKELAHTPIHFAIDDMQIAEDLQVIIGHMCMQWLCENPPQ